MCGSTVKKEYYIQGNEVIILQKYFNENNEFLDQQIIYYLSGDNFAIVLEDGDISKKPLSYLEKDSWIRTDRTYEINQEIEKISDSEIRIVKTVDKAIETTTFKKLDFEVKDVEVVNEIISYASTLYLTDKSETVFKGTNIFSLNLEEIRFNDTGDSTKFLELRNAVRIKE